MRVDLDGWSRGWGRFDAVGVDQITQLFAGLEERDALCWDVYFFACFWVSPEAGITLAGSEAAKAADLNFVSGLECADDGVEESINDNFSVTPG